MNEGISGHHFHGTIRREEQYQTVDFNVAEGENGFVMELWGDEPNVYTIGILSPGGENIERMQLKMGEFRSVRRDRKAVPDPALHQSGGTGTV